MGEEAARHSFVVIPVMGPHSHSICRASGSQRCRDIPFVVAFVIHRSFLLFSICVFYYQRLWIVRILNPSSYSYLISSIVFFTIKIPRPPISLSSAESVISRIFPPGGVVGPPIIRESDHHTIFLCLASYRYRRCATVPDNIGEDLVCRDVICDTIFIGASCFARQSSKKADSPSMLSRFGDTLIFLIFSDGTALILIAQHSDIIKLGRFSYKQPDIVFHVPEKFLRVRVLLPVQGSQHPIRPYNVSAASVASATPSV